MSRFVGRDCRLEVAPDTRSGVAPTSARIAVHRPSRDLADRAGWSRDTTLSRGGRAGGAAMKHRGGRPESEGLTQIALLPWTERG